MSTATATATVAMPAQPVAPPDDPFAGFRPQAIDHTALRQTARETLYADMNDAALLDEVYGVTVAFINPPVVNCYPAEQMTGIVLDVKTSRYGVRKLLVKADKLSLAKWIALDSVQFVWAMAGER